MIKLEPNHIKLYILHRYIGQLIPNIEIDDIRIYTTFIVGLLTVFIWPRNRIRIVNFWIDFLVPMENLHARELSSPNENYIACFRIRQYPFLLIVEFNMPFDLYRLKLYMDNLYDSILQNQNAADISYQTIESYFSTNTSGMSEEIFRKISSSHSHIMTIYDTNGKKICLFRKLESLYLLYVPTYIRKPLIPNEGAFIENNVI